MSDPTLQEPVVQQARAGLEQNQTVQGWQWKHEEGEVSMRTRLNCTLQGHRNPPKGMWKGTCEGKEVHETARRLVLPRWMELTELKKGAQGPGHEGPTTSATLLQSILKATGRTNSEHKSLERLRRVAGRLDGNGF